MLRRTPVLVVVLALLAGFGGQQLGLWADGDAEPARPGGEELRIGGSASGRVVRVVDGDTIHVSLAGGVREKVRYIGIDTPESVKPNTPVQCFAKAASRRNERLVDGRRVELRFDAELRDRYGRLLAYVYRLPDRLHVNAELVRGGFATTATFPPNVRFAERFAALARDAREAGRGLWGRC